MNAKRFSQEELNRIMALRIKRERERCIKAFEGRMKKCMASVHLLLYQEMRALAREITADGQDVYPPMEPLETDPSQALLDTGKRRPRRKYPRDRSKGGEGLA